MLKSLSFASVFALGMLTGLPLAASAMTPAPSVVVAGSVSTDVETVRMHHRMHRMRHMRRGNPSARGWKKNF